MKKISRRSFIAKTGAVMATALFAPVARVFSATVQSADIVINNGVIVTINDKMPLAQAMAVRGGRILAVGTNQEIQQYISTSTKVIDLTGKCVSPGIIDAHSHPIAYGHMEREFVIVRPPKVDSFNTLNNELAKAAKQKPEGEWIIARGFNTFKEGRYPRRWEIDKAVPKHPVLVIHWSGQFGIANTLAFQKAGLLNANTKDPYGGLYIRDKSGVPDGPLIHYPAIYSVHEDEQTNEDQIGWAKWAFEQFVSVGVTCIHDNFCLPLQGINYIKMERAGNIPCRLRLYPYIKNLEQCKNLVSKMRGYNSPIVRIQGIKLAVDGYALMYEVPKQHRDMAIPMHPQPIFNEIIATIHNAGYQVDVHAAGDKGVDWTLEAFAQAAGSTAKCREKRHRIEHFGFLKLDSIKRAAELNVPVCQQPCIIEVRADDFAERLGAKGRQMANTVSPIKTFTSEGVHIAIGADVPAFPSHLPMDSIRCSMDRITGSGRHLDSNEAITFMEGLRCHTIGSAYASFDEKELGSLETGKFADFVIWNNDLRKIKTGKEATSLHPLATYVAGKAVYQMS